ncbi:SGNH/GDSL hydrolase family protein [Brevundimonas basaltis]|uniref:Lysophospholipase L1-like esterase n=1 Tax=Brevundimonas basaltis TaxID=472166 RepID=A0A7W8MGX4_9CAUL|nr:GDSL-type esterase/lipase family protein [Brevundimonas basaltis]MBB5292124.1 lysophospholipase L1-like esterase [Brevundimonas basaltis]
MRTALGALVAMVLAAPPVLAQTPYEAAPALEPGRGVCPAGVCQPAGLRQFFEALAAIDAGGSRARPVHILQLGDSHTAGDRITGKLRAELQREFGRGGRGVLPPGIPYDGYAPFHVAVGSTGWMTEQAPLQPPAGAPAPRMGLSGARSVAAGDAVMGFELEPGFEVTRVGVCGRARGPGPGLAVEVDGVVRPMDFNGAGPDAEVCREMRLGRPADDVRLRPLGDGVVIESVRLEKAGPGLVVSNLGRVGATIRDLASRDEATVAVELATWRPDLIILAYGANEGFDDALDAAAYEALLRGQLARLRRLAPRASLMILGAPDGQRAGVTGGCSADGQRAPPPSLAVVRDVQRRVAADMGVAFWDWHGRMGGDCSADRLALMADPYVRGDRVHFTGAGADWIGGMLAGDLMAAYGAWTVSER